MEVTLYGRYVKFKINPENINYIVEFGYKCETYFQGGEEFPISYSSLKNTLLKQFPRVFSYDFNLPVYVNTKNIAFCEDKHSGSITFTDGTKIKNLSGMDLRNMTMLMEEDYTK